jgi:transcriptional regulator GlxA family with amidase domain
MEEALTARLRSPRRHPVILAALESFGGAGAGSSVRDAAQSVGLSQRRFITVFTSDVGLTAKRFCRILRFQHVHALTRRPGSVEWAQLGLD